MQHEHSCKFCGADVSPGLVPAITYRCGSCGVAKGNRTNECKLRELRGRRNAF